MVTGAAEVALAARAAVLAPMGAAAALVGAKTASVERSTAPATDGFACAPAETEVVPDRPCGEVCSAETWWEGGCIATSSIYHAFA